MWQVTQTPSFLDKNWPINWSWAWLMTPGYFGRCCLQNQLRICIRYKFLDQSPATGIIHASCASSRLCEAESSYPYANIIQIMINTQLARQLVGREHVLGVFYPLFTPYHVTMIVSWWNLCSLPPALALSSLATGPRRVLAPESGVTCQAHTVQGVPKKVFCVLCVENSQEK